MSELTLYLLRHGESEANVAHIFGGRAIDPALTAVGRGQARLQGMALRDVPFQAIYASTLRRAQETAVIVGQALGLRPALTNDLREADLGRLDGRCYDDGVLWSIFEDVLARWQVREYGAGFPDGETLQDLQVRLARFLAALPHTGGPILLVGHEVVFMAAIWLFCRNPGTSLLDWRLRHGGLAVMSRNGAPGFRLDHFDIGPESRLLLKV
jgi:probable phosphoglycerate mutase